MPNEVNIYTPRYLAEVVRLAPPVFTFFRDTFFTNVRTFPTKAIDFDLVKGDRRMRSTSGSDLMIIIPDPELSRSQRSWPRWSAGYRP